MTTMKKPDHLEKFPCMQPWIGSSYEDNRYKRLLVIGESHYMPPESTIHLDPERWYQSNEDHLGKEERAWVHTKGVILGQFVEPHRGLGIFRNIGDEIVRIMKDSGLTPDEFPREHIAFYNYFMRPAPKTGSGIEGHVAPLDFSISEEVLRWFVQEHQPQLVIFVSRFAGRYGEKVVCEHGIPCISTPHPGRPWWNRHSNTYGRDPIYAGDPIRPRRGRDLFRDFLKKYRWITSDHV